MNRLRMITMCMLAMMATSLSVKAQEITVTLLPGWTWISYTRADTLDIATAMGSFTPTEGDKIKSQYAFAEYHNGVWAGSLTQFCPGLGYMYKSNRTMPATLSFNAQQPAPQVVVTTSEPTGITTYGMICGGEVTNSGISGVLVRGVCWSTQQNPTINDPHTTDGYGMGNFTSTVEGLEMNTTYYVRAYALTTEGVGYGEQKMFSTKNGVPTLTTSAASEIGTTWATCGGDISDDGGIEVTERGICWSTEHNPTIAGDHGSNGVGLGSFSVSMNNLELNTTYYVRAYAINGYTTAYGNEVSFRTEVAQTWPNGKLPGQFSVSATHQVQFSQGNLQYRASTNSWKFADRQYDGFIGRDNVSPAYDGWIDLFGWGTSGWNNGNIYYHPYDTEHLTEWPASDYGYGYGPTDGTNYDYDLIGIYANADWGVYNAILNGGNQPNQWRTLTSSEWSYVLFSRSTSSGIRFANAIVSDANGILLLPDDWDSSIYTLNYTNRMDAPYSTNVISDADWAVIETEGGVFISFGTSNYPFFGYWTATCSGNQYAWIAPSYTPTVAVRWDGYPVRLVSVVLPQVSTMAVDVSDNSACVIGNLIDAGNVDIMACGVCYSTTSNPTIDDVVIIAEGVTIGEFTAILNDLTPNTTYYARAFASNNSGGTSYGDEIIFTTTESSQSWTNGILPGSFSVSENQQVQFSQGNLQYIGSTATPYWKFADHQWDYLGTTTGQDGDGENVDRDLFGWGTSGYDHGANCYQPWSTSTIYYNDYNAYGNYQYNLYDQTGQADWGYNPIINGGNQENQWRTLTYVEWNYLLNNRTTISGIRYAKAKVFGVNGVILLPDDWSESIYNLNNTNSGSAPYNGNVVTDWTLLESAGAVFLSAAGRREGTSVSGVGSNGNYWSASISGSNYAVEAYFYDSHMSTGYTYRSHGYSVRLVRNVASHAYVDLGLPSSTLWATCNVGADAPEDYGDYFAWGETQPKDTYDWNTYQYCNGSSTTLTKYCSNSSYGYNGFTDNLTTLLPEDDAATVNWGSDWRMPTKEEWEELYNNTTCTWTTQNGVNGRLFTAANGNSLFLPAAGVRYNSSLSYAGSYGSYWSSSSLGTDYPSHAWRFGFNSGSNSGSYGVGGHNRYYGFTVRPVRSARQN